MKRSNSARLELISNKKRKQDNDNKPIKCYGFFYAIIIFIVFKLITIKSNY